MTKRTTLSLFTFVLVLLGVVVFACQQPPGGPTKLGGSYPLNFLNFTNSPAPTAVAPGHVYAWQDPNLAFAAENAAGVVDSLDFISGDGGLGFPNPQARQVLRYENTAQTVGAVTQTILTLPIPVNTSVALFIVATGRDAGSGMIWSTMDQLGMVNI